MLYNFTLIILNHKTKIIPDISISSHFCWNYQSWNNSGPNTIPEPGSKTLNWTLSLIILLSFSFGFTGILACHKMLLKVLQSLNFVGENGRKVVSYSVCCETSSECIISYLQMKSTISELSLSGAIIILIPFPCNQIFKIFRCSNISKKPQRVGKIPRKFFSHNQPINFSNFSWWSLYF